MRTVSSVAVPKRDIILIAAIQLVHNQTASAEVARELSLSQDAARDLLLAMKVAGREIANENGLARISEMAERRPANFTFEGWTRPRDAVLQPSSVTSGTKKTGAQPREIKDLTIILGPPGPAALKQRIASIAEKTGRSAEDVFVEVIHNLVTDMSKEKDGNESQLDRIFGSLFGTKIRVSKFVPTYFVARGGKKSPAVMFYPGEFGVDRDLANAVLGDPAKREALGSMFGYLLQTESAEVVVVREGEAR